MTITEDTTPEDVIEALGHLNGEAKKCRQVVGNSEWQSPWDIAHERINDALDKLELIRG
jgi:hypothetical protein